MLGRGRGVANSPFLLDNDGAQDRAATDAHFAMADNAQMTLCMARCPRCQGKARGPYVKFWIFAVLKMLALLGLLALIALLTGFAWVWGAAVIAVIVFYLFDLHWQWASVDRRVLFHEVEQRRADKFRGER